MVIRVGGSAPYLELRRDLIRPRIRLPLRSMWFRCVLKRSLWSRIMPRNFALVVEWILSASRRRKTDSGSNCFRVKMTSCDFVGEIERLRSRRYLLTLLRLHCTAFRQSLRRGDLQKIAMSSANWIISQEGCRNLEMSRRYTLKSVGLRMLPCGTPLNVRNGPVRFPLMTKLRWRVVRRFQINVPMLAGMPSFLRSLVNMFGSTLSKAHQGRCRP